MVKKLGLLRSNDSTGARTSLKIWIRVFQSLSQLFLLTYFDKCTRTFLKLTFKGPYPRSKEKKKFRPCLLTYSTKSKELHRIKRDARAARFVVHFFTLVLDDHARCETSRNFPVTRFIEEMLLSKFRSKTQWIGLVQPEKFRKYWTTFWGGPLFPVGPVWILVEWIAPHILISCSISFSVSEFHVSRCRHLNLVESNTALLLLFFPSLKVRVATRFTAETRADCLK